MSTRQTVRAASLLMLAIAGALMLPLISRAAPDPKMLEPKAAAPMAQAANGFGVALYDQLAAKTGNVFFSPFSVSSALTVTQRGARGKTAEEMASVLHLPADDTVNDANQALFTQLEDGVAKKPYQLAVANALWLQAGAPFNQSYLATAQTSFGAGLEQLDFVTAADASRLHINDWVAKQTNDKIKDLLPAGSVTPATKLVITNAVYFKGTWESQFNKSATQNADFTGLDGKAISAPLMHVKEHFGYTSDNDKAVLELPYQGDDLSMLVLLPNKKDAASLAAMEKTITPDSLKALTAGLRHEEVTVTLPKWKMTEKYDLTGTLQAMGMKLAFGRTADFSGMNGRSGLQISAVVHQAYIDVNEEGTEAAGATGVMMRSMAMARPAQPILFTADHPFVYAIIHKPTNTILFMGRMEDPR